MSEFFQPDVKVHSGNVKANIQVNPKTQGTQNTNFQEILVNIKGTEVSKNISLQNNVSIDSLHQSNLTQDQNNAEEKNNNFDKNQPTNLKSELLQTKSPIFSSFIPQKPKEIDKETMNLLTSSNQTKETKSKDSKNKKVKKSDLPRKSLGSIKPQKNKEEKNLLDTDIENRNQLGNSETPQNLKKEATVHHTIRHEKEFQEEEQEKRNKKQQQQDFNEKENEEGVSDEEIFSILKAYDLKEISNIPAREGPKLIENYDEWLKSLLFGVSKENLTTEDAEKTAKYITIKAEITEKDKNLIQSIISDLLKHQVKTISSNIVLRLEAKTIEDITKIFPPEFFKGILKNLSTKKKKEKNLFTTLFNFISGQPNSEEDLTSISKILLDSANKEEEALLLSILKGNIQEKHTNKIYSLINKLKAQEALIPGFFEFVADSFLDAYDHGYSEHSHLLMNIIEKYYRGEKLSHLEIKKLSDLITKKNFDSKKFNLSKIAEVIANIIENKNVSETSLKLTLKLAQNNLLAYLPHYINKEVKEILFNSSLYSNEIEKEEFAFEENSTEVMLSGRLLIQNMKLKDSGFKLSITLTNLHNGETYEVNLDSNLNFDFMALSGKYRLTKLNFYKEEEKKVIFLEKMKKKLTQLSFVIEPLYHIFYYGSLELNINFKSVEVKKLKLTNDYSNLIATLKNKGINPKEKIIKLNPSLYK